MFDKNIVSKAQQDGYYNEEKEGTDKFVAACYGCAGTENTAGGIAYSHG